MNRRDCLKLAAALALPAAVSRVYALPAQADARFLLVFLRGGYDAANVLVPAGSDFYYAVRPSIAIRRPAPEDPAAALALRDAFAQEAAARHIGDWALHPVLGPTVLPLWQRGQVAFVPFAGTDDMSRSHFETQDSIEAGLPAGKGAAGHGNGFLNRLAQAMGGRAAPVAFTDGLPLVLAGVQQVPNVSLKGAARTPFDARQSALLARMYAGTRFSAAVGEGFELRETVARESAMNPAMNPSDPRAAEMQAASRRALSARGFEAEARRMAGLMRDRFNLGFIDVGGWDTHVNQGAAQGQLAGLLENLGRGLAGFAEEMGPAWDRTVVVIVSEFGRTFRENGTHGTDHGHGSVYWVAGGAVRGGRIAGEQVEVGEKTLNQGRDWPVVNEYRGMLAGMFRRMYGLDPGRLAKVFPGVAARDIGLV